MSKNKYTHTIHLRAWLRLFVVGFVVYAVAAGFGGLQLILDAVQSAQPQYILLAAVAIALSYACAALTYTLLSSKKIQFVPTLLVQVAGGLVNRMLPAGLGGMGLNVFYLRKQGHSVALASTIAATNNILGFVGNALLVLVSLLLFPLDLGHLKLPDISYPVLIGIFMGIFVGVILVFRSQSLAVKLRSSLAETAKYLRNSLRRPGKSASALGSSSLVTALHALGLYLVLSGIGEPESWSIALLAISMGAFVGAATPTPGGLGGAEAGIAATLIAFSVPVNVSVAAALVYRGLTYWLPLLPGYAALRIVEKRYL